MATELMMIGGMIGVCARTLGFRKVVLLGGPGYFFHDMWTEFLRQEDVVNILYSVDFSRQYRQDHQTLLKTGNNCPTTFGFPFPAINSHLCYLDSMIHNFCRTCNHWLFKSARPHLNGAGIHIAEGSPLTAVSLIARPLIGELMAVAFLSVSSFIYPSERLVLRQEPVIGLSPGGILRKGSVN